MNIDRRDSSRSDTEPLNSPESPFEDVETAYDSGDLGMQQNETSPYSPPLATPNSVTLAKGASYMYPNTPTSTCDVDPNSDKESLMGDSFLSPGHNLVKRFDHNESRKKLFKTGGPSFSLPSFPVP
ncbi:hypothetical protein BDU57DRAFT_260879 [Ampelomyces quisqualis]|uniref:Uncharacterized protein n=1 Tax=Ampelomyces quisqualis TaxID=50730 RepID=A0A6A5QJP5_AMPQU|nr:hypothetical protein BDU57DRAFT_260879 [Ampelomyces quisqualis]